MGIRNRVQRLAWAIGRPFCEIGDRELDRRRSALAEEVRLLRQHREEDRRVIEIAVAHTPDCEQRLADLERRMNLINDDRLALIQQLTKEDVPGLWMLKEEA